MFGNLLKAVYRKWPRQFHRFGMHNYRRAKLHYFLVSGAFVQEQRSVLSGISRYENDIVNRQGKGIRYLLRRNVHRLEKGLIFPNRRRRFAVGYIEETVGTYAQVLGDGHPIPGDGPLIRWATDVLGHYFDVAGEDPAIDRAREQYLALGPDPSGRAIPYPRGDSGPPVLIEAMEALARRRRSIRWFLPDPVDRRQIDRALTVALQSPSACNRQPYEFRVYDDPDLIRKVARIPAGTGGYGHQIPCVVVVVGQLNAYKDEGDRHLIYIDASLAVMSFEFALECLGLGSCTINWRDDFLRDQAMRELIGLGQDERVIMLVAVGHPDPARLVAYSQKKPLDEVRSYNLTRDAGHRTDPEAAQAPGNPDPDPAVEPASLVAATAGPNPLPL